MEREWEMLNPALSSVPLKLVCCALSVSTLSMCVYFESGGVSSETQKPKILLRASFVW